MLFVKTPLNLLFILLPIIGFSQPGGGGGVQINHLYDQSGNEIDIEKSSNYHLTCFLLKDTVLASKNLYTQLENHFYTFQVDSIGYTHDYRDSSVMLKTRFMPSYKYKGIGLKTLGSCIWKEGIYFDNFRIMLSTNTDTMIIDFIKIISGNPAGINNRFDSLTFKPGYFQYKRKNIYQFSESKDSMWSITTLNLDSYLPLTASEKRAFKPFGSTIINEYIIEVEKDIKELNDKITQLKESDEWKLYDEVARTNALEMLEAEKSFAELRRKTLLLEKKRLPKKP